MVALLLLNIVAWPQAGSPPAPANSPLVYAGKPLRVPVTCSEEEIQGYGMSCTVDSPCPVYLELTSLEVLPGRMVVSGNLHTNSVTLSSIVLTSEDGGKSWVEAHPRIGHAVLDRTQFIDLAKGWISGQIVGALPRDPFFLLTDDGGKSWRRRPVFSDPHVGSIEGFHFTTANDGKVLVDRATSEEGGRYAVLESKTGGESWSILQITSSVPQNLRLDRPPSAAWRLHANAASKAYQLEKRQGQAWMPVAAFQVETGSCAPEELRLTPPPTEAASDAARPGAIPDDAVEVFQVGGGKPKAAGSKKKKR